MRKKRMLFLGRVKDKYEKKAKKRKGKQLSGEIYFKSGVVSN